MKVTFLPSTRADLIEIGDYISMDSPSRALGFISTIKERCIALGDFPKMGVEREELRHGIRSIPLGSYVIFYREHQNTVEIIRILHSARDIEALFDKNQ